MHRPGCEVCAHRRPDVNAIDDGADDVDGAWAGGAARVEGYQRLINLDQSDAVPNADPFDCPVCLMNVPAGIGVTLRDCLHTFCKQVLGQLLAKCVTFRSKQIANKVCDTFFFSFY